MRAQIESSISCLKRFVAQKEKGAATVDRREVVAHATLSALAHHWPSQTALEIRELVTASLEIKESERSRWMTQRRIAIAKLAKWLDQRSL